MLRRGFLSGLAALAVVPLARVPAPGYGRVVIYRNADQWVSLADLYLEDDAIDMGQLLADALAPPKFGDGREWIRRVR